MAAQEVVSGAVVLAREGAVGHTEEADDATRHSTAGAEGTEDHGISTRVVTAVGRFQVGVQGFADGCQRDVTITVGGMAAFCEEVNGVADSGYLQLVIVRGGEEGVDEGGEAISPHCGGAWGLGIFRPVTEATDKGDEATEQRCGFFGDSVGRER